MLTLHPFLSDHAVLQRGRPLVLTGRSAPGAEVTVEFAGETIRVPASESGTWRAEFAAREAGGPFDLVVSANGRTIRRSDLLVGEVWLCSGQSNMEWTLAMTPGTGDDVAGANEAAVRCFTVHRTPRAEPAEELAGKWDVASPAAAGTFSAVAWFFACRLRAELGCPVGIVVAAFGGTQIASWMPRETLAARPEYDGLRAEAEPVGDELQAHVDTGRTPESAGWETGETSGWDVLDVPGMWQQQGWQLNGAVWYRRTTELPEAWRGRALNLVIGACDDFDDTYVNGERVGGMGTENPSAYATRRVYPVSAEKTAGGRLDIAVRVFDQWGFGGIVHGVFLHPVDDPEVTLSLDGVWNARVEKAYPLRTSSRPIPPEVLFNGMIHPLRDYAFRGALWYQGESDVARAALYRLLLPDLIASWRALWGNPLLPVGIVQLANHKPPQEEPGPSDWAELRDAQWLTARATPAAGLAVAIDTGEADNIHPRRKKPVGERLASWALAEVYDRPSTPWRSPEPADHWICGEAMRVRMTHVGAGLRAGDGRSLSGFQIAGADRRWVWAAAELVAADVIEVRAKGLPRPVAVRYGWQDNPVCNLENSGGFPATPFRTDDWELSTAFSPVFP